MSAAVVAAFSRQGLTVGTLEDRGGDNGRGPAADLTDPGYVEDAVRRAEERIGGIGVLVFVAGDAPAGSFLEVTPQELRATIDADVGSALMLAREVVRRLVLRGAPGRLIFVTSTAGLRVAPGALRNAVAAAMTQTIAQVAAVELGPSGVTSNVVAAGWVDHALSPHLDLERVRMATPGGRLVEPGDVGDACVFLASPAAAGISGAVLPVDGGYSVTKSPGGSPFSSDASRVS